MSMIGEQMFTLGRLLPQAGRRPCSWKRSANRWASVHRLELKLERMAGAGDARLKELLGIGEAGKSVQPLRLRLASYFLWRLLRYTELSFSYNELTALLPRQDFDDILALRRTLMCLAKEKWLTCRHGFQLTGGLTALLIGERLQDAERIDDDVNCFFADLHSEGFFDGVEE